MNIINDVGSYNPFSQYQLADPIYTDGIREVVMRLGHGDKVVIDSVRWVNTIDQAHVVAVGSTTGKNSSPSVKFEYFWGNAWRLSRAPWEDLNVPKVRNLEWGGTLKKED